MYSAWRGDVLDGERVRAVQRLVQIDQFQGVTLLHTVVVADVDELQRQHPEVGQILPVDAGEGLGDHDA